MVSRRGLAAQDRDVQHRRHSQQAGVDEVPGLAADAIQSSNVPGKLGGAAAFRVPARFDSPWITPRVHRCIHRQRADGGSLCPLIQNSGDRFRRNGCCTPPRYR
jgi:hypothetical protein